MLKKFKNLIDKRVISRFGNLTKGQEIYVENMYKEWLKEPRSVNKRWNEYFENTKMEIVNKIDGSSQKEDEIKMKNLMIKINRIIKNYRIYGYNIADLDPLNDKGNQEWFTEINAFDKEIENFSEEELNVKIKFDSNLEGFSKEKEEWTPREIIERIREIYIKKISFDYMQIPNREICNWIRNRIETKSNYSFSNEEKTKILDRLLETDTLNKIFSELYPNKIRYGCEGIDSFVSGLGHAIDFAEKNDVKQVIIGMANRARLNILGCIAKKPYREIFSDYEETNPDLIKSKAEIYDFCGEVPYQQPSSTQLRYPGGKDIVVSIFPNSRHKETINPVVLGSVKARLSRKYPEKTQEILPILIHSDAALLGQGVNFENQQLERLDKYNVGGCVHIVLNNQIGCTTDPGEYKSPVHCTNLSNINKNFVIHVDAEEPELVNWAIETAILYRKTWCRDVFVNIIGYRRFGQTELDDPFITLPLLYAKISKMPSIPDLYSRKLISEGFVTKEEIANIVNEKKTKLNKEYEISKTGNFTTTDVYLDYHKGFISLTQSNSGVKRDDLKKISKIINTIPNEFNLNPLVKKVYEERDYCVQGETLIDWGNAEMLAYGTLLHQGFGIRLTGEDVERGTFSHRHAVAIDQSHNTGFLALGNLLNEKNKNLLTVNNSPLSEYSTLGFEYGFSVNAPQFLTLWEAQFGDFANGGQVIIDQFIANGEKKWGRMSGLVLLLPHGYDGQGPEHSNCRIERYLASVSDDYLLAKENPSYRKGINYKTNMTVCYVTSAANIFLLLRKQLLRNFRKPLIVLQSKKLLRSKLAASDFNDFLEPNIFKKLIDDPIQNKQKVTKIIFCSGQVYFDVIQKRSDLKLDDSVAVIRLEQVAPFPYVEASDIIKNYNKDAEVLWVQEEAYNYGPFTYVRPRIDIILEENGFKPIEYRGRKIQATTSTGFLKEHKKELEDFLTETFK